MLESGRGEKQEEHIFHLVQNADLRLKGCTWTGVRADCHLMFCELHVSGMKLALPFAIMDMLSTFSSYLSPSNSVGATPSC